MTDATAEGTTPDFPLVSVLVITYQHASFIQQCLEGVLSQQADFEFEVLIGDDGSSDGTSEICRQYQQQYPDRVRHFVYDRKADRSAYSGGPGRYNFMQTFAQVKGEFIAICEGDDYWTDSHKLQTQVRFLQDHPDYSACFHSVLVETPAGLKKDFITAVDAEALTLADLAKGNCIHTPSVVYRNQFQRPFPDFFNTSPVLDYLLHCEAASRGEIKFLDKEMAVYRVHGDSYWSSTPPAVRMKKWVEVLFPLVNFFDDERANENFKQQLFNAALSWLSQSQQQDESQRQHLLARLAEVDSERLVSLLAKGAGAAQGPFDIAVQTAQSTGQILPEVIANMMATTHSGDKQALAKEQLLLQMAEYLIKSALKEADYSQGKSIGSKRRKELLKAHLLFNQQYSASEETEPVRQMRQQLLQLLQHDNYQVWIRKHALREVDAEILAERMMLHWPLQPVLHCFLFVLPGEQNLLADTIDSLATQLFKNWQLTVVAATPSPDPIFDEADFLHWRTVTADEDPYQVLNEEISREPSHWVSFIEPGLQFSPHSLAKIGDYINLNPTSSFIYSDDDLIDSYGQRSHPRFKPAFNLDLLRSSPYIGNGWMPASYLLQLGGVAKLAGAENYDLALRWFDAFGDGAFCHIPDVLVHKSNQVDRPFDSLVGEQALRQHFDRNGLSVTIGAGYVDNSYRVEYLHQRQPKVSIIIPTKDKLEFLQPCVESLLEKTGYPDYEVLIVDNQSRDPDTLAFYEQLAATHGDKVSILFYDQPFNFAAINNWAADQAKGELLLLLNNDTEIIQPDWLSRMVMHGQREDVGVVGARLLYPESGRVQHIGVILGLSQTADHHYNTMLGLNDSSHMERARLDQNFSAVTAAVMLVKREVYQKVGGMDADNLAVLFNDVDLCLRIGEQGYRIVWTPYAMAVHHGSSSLRENLDNNFYVDWQYFADKKKRVRAEQCYMFEQWLPILADDPAYNRNLSLREHHMSLDTNALQNWDIHHHLRLRCFGVPIKGGSGEYRMRQPFDALAKSGKALCEVGSTHLTLTELVRLQPDTVVFQNAISDNEIEYLRMYRDFRPQTQLIFLLDDLLHDLPEKSSQYKKMKAAYRDARTRLREALGYCDRLIVSTQPLLELCKGMIDDIVVIPNRLSKDRWLNLDSLRGQSEKPRVGWAGAQQHQGDLELIIEVVKATANEVDWVFFGMCPDEIAPYVKEMHGFVDIEDYPRKLASLNLDLAVAPLEVHDFNDAKSNLRLLEYGILGWPVVCSDVFPYRTNQAPVMRVDNEVAEWVAAIRQILADPIALRASGDKLKAWVHDHYMLEDHLDEWLRALETASTETMETEKSHSLVK